MLAAQTAIQACVGTNAQVSVARCCALARICECLQNPVFARLSDDILAQTDPPSHSNLTCFSLATGVVRHDADGDRHPCDLQRLHGDQPADRRHDRSQRPSPGRRNAPDPARQLGAGRLHRQAAGAVHVDGTRRASAQLCHHSSGQRCATPASAPHCGMTQMSAAWRRCQGASSHMPLSPRCSARCLPAGMTPPLWQGSAD